MAKKLGKKARKFARKHLQSAAKRNRKQRSQFARRPRRGSCSPVVSCSSLFSGWFGSVRLQSTGALLLVAHMLFFSSGGSGRGNERDGDGDDEMPQRAIDNVM